MIFLKQYKGHYWLSLLLWFSPASKAYVLQDAFLIGAEVGYAFDQTIENQTTQSNSSVTVIEDMEDGSGFVYGGHLGYLIGRFHRLKLGASFYNTKVYPVNDLFVKYYKFNNIYIHFDYDYIKPVIKNASWYVGPNAGYQIIKLQSASNTNGSTSKYDPKSTMASNIGGFALGLQTGLQWVVDNVIVTLDVRYVRSFGGYVMNKGLTNESKVTSPQVVIGALGMSFYY